MNDKIMIICFMFLGLFILGFISLIIIVWVIYGNYNIDEIPAWALFIMFGGKR